MTPGELSSIRSASSSDAATVPHRGNVARVGHYIEDLFTLGRPKHWVKNVFVLMPLAFAEHSNLPNALAAAITAFFCFSLLSSAVYFLNDAVDAAADRNHPTKRLRPVAAGRVSRHAALLGSLLLTVAALTLAQAVLPARFVLIAVLYVANNILYSFALKTHAIVDVISIALGFVLRLFAGAAAVGVIASSWLVVCGFSLALFLGFGKRRAEVGQFATASQFRQSLQSYTQQNLDALMAVCSSVSLLAYMMYTVSPDTIRVHHTDKLVYSVPFVVYGVFRFIFKVQERAGEGPVEILTSDRAFLINGLLWMASVIILLRFAW